MTSNLLLNRSFFLSGNTSSSSCPFPLNATGRILLNDPGFLTWQCLVGILCLIGALCNAFLITVILKYRSLRRNSGTIIAHLLLIHLLLCSVSLPMAANRVAKVTSPSIFGPVDCDACRFQHFSQATFNGLVNWSDALLGMHRLIAIFLPTYFHLCNRRIVQFACMCICYALTLAYSLPGVFGQLAFYRISPIGTCAFVSRSRFSTTMLSVTAYCPVVIVFLATTIIIARATVTAKKKRAQLKGDNSRNSLEMSSRQAELAKKVNGYSERQKRTTRMLVASFALSLTCQMTGYAFLLAGLSSRYPETQLCVWFLQLTQYTVTPVGV